jgi:hypothetical protein
MAGTRRNNVDGRWGIENERFKSTF